MAAGGGRRDEPMMDEREMEQANERFRELEGLAEGVRLRKAFALACRQLQAAMGVD